MTPPNNPEEWKAIADQFMRIWHFPYCCGTLDGKHIAIKKPARSGSLYYKYKGFFSIVMLALLDGDYNFIWADVGGNGACSDAQMYNESELQEAVEDGSISFPDPKPLPNDTEDVPYYFIWDDAFALRTTMMKPYSHMTMDREQRIFIYRLPRAWRVVENAFGILANKFRILLSTMGHSPSTVRQIVKTCIILHNLMRVRYPALPNQQIDCEHPINKDFIPGASGQGPNPQDTQTVTASFIDSKRGNMQRNLIKHWRNSPAGSVAWQDRMIGNIDNHWEINLSHLYKCLISYVYTRLSSFCN